ncbi:hypothetical protein D9619_011989 [Psilocybe cf. subviscida]|uniref:Uncharacterized protein n=1 Tax=Psilocybe cf. subviscida TaxID=2480587 RepID=A0A8H5EW92_9AGAR|nr:hypothetical protein D9619_011989 [Psilocybe cf. subviscida]
MANPVSPSILIDDSNPAIQYNGPWTTPLSTDGLPASKFIIFNTLHVLQTLNGSFSFNFSGVAVSVFDVQINQSRNYTAECFVDGLSVNTNKANSSELSFLQPLCAAFGLPAATPHIISVYISVTPNDIDNPNLSGFSLDYILIEPPPAMSLDGYDLFIKTFNNEAASQPELSSHPFTIQGVEPALLSGSSGWRYDNDVGYQTISPGAQFNVTFTGIQLWWFLGNDPCTKTACRDSTSTFIVDGGPPTQIDNFLAPFFNSPVLEKASHSVSVVYQGSNGTSTNATIPLTMQYLIIQTQINTIESTPQSGTPGPTRVMGSKAAHDGLLGGALTGGLILLLILASGCFAYFRWRRNKGMLKDQDTTTADKSPRPYVISPGTSVAPIAEHKAQRNRHHTVDPAVLEGGSFPQSSRRTADGNDTRPPEIQIYRGTKPRTHPSPGVDHLQLRRTAPTITHRQIRQHVVEDTPTNAEIADTQFASGAIPQEDDIHEVDSGLRMPSGEFVRILPPIYTTH